MYLYKELEGGTETPLERLKNKLSTIFLCFDLQAAGKRIKNPKAIKQDMEDVTILLEDLETDLNKCGEIL